MTLLYRPFENTRPNAYLQGVEENAIRQMGDTVTFAALNDFTLKMTVTTGGVVYVNWGDGTNKLWVSNGAEQTVTHDYATAGKYTVKIYGDLASVSGFNIADQGTLIISLDNISKLSNLSILYCYNSPISGNLSSLTGMPLTILYGYNSSISGNLSSLTGMPLTILSIPNTIISGNLSSLTGMPLIGLACYSTLITGDLRSLAAMSIVTLSCQGLLLDYTSGSIAPWGGANINTSSCTLTSTEVDNFLIDLSDGCGANGSLNIAGTNAARTSASDAAKTAILAFGWVLTVNE